MKQIIVGVDGSPESRAATKKGAELAAATHALLRLVCVIPPFEAFRNVVASPRERSELRAAASSIIDEVAQDVGSGVPIEKEIGDGTPAEVLAGLAARPEIDMVMVGHRGRGKLERILIGSVADRLVQISPKPVLVVH